MNAASRQDRQGSGRTEPIPNFFIIGAPKCATSAMHGYLGRHPQIYMSAVKEPMHFCTDFEFDGGRRTEAAYLDLFAEADDARYVGESSVFYMLSGNAAREIHAWQPEAKLLAMLRDPVDLIASHHNQIVYEGYETEKDFRRALALEAGRREADRGRRLRVRDKVLHYRDIARFHEQLVRYLALFPREQLHVVFYEDVLADLPGAYRSVLEFLGVDPEFRPAFPVENARKEVRSRKFADFLRATPDGLTLAWQRLIPSARMRSKIKWKLQRANTRFVERQAVPTDLRRMLIEDLRDDIEKLSGLLDRDLGSWLEVERHGG